MKVRAILSLVGVALVLAMAVPVRGQAAEDVAGAQDPDGMKRIEGAVIVGYDMSGFDEVSVPLGKVGYDGAESKMTAEGPRVRVIYAVPGDRSPFEVIRNYQVELREQGYETLWDCGKAECGPTGAMVKLLYPLGGRLTNIPKVTDHVFSLPRDDHRFAVLRNAETGRMVSIYAAFETFDQFPQIHDKTMVLMDVVEGAPMTRRMEFVTAEQMASALGTDGRVSLYGVQFAHDSDALTPASDPTLAEIAQFMAGAPEVQVFVVGHTDMTGGYDYNLDLSRRWAAAVVAALSGRYGVAAERMQPAGVGPLSPVGENESEDGRAKNRRVELVRR